MIQGSLLEPLAHDSPKSGVTHRSPTETEKRAAIAIAPKTGTRRREVLAALVRAGGTGATRWELVAATGQFLSSVCGRLAELEAGAWAEKTKRIRISSQTGYPGEVYVATERGKRAINGAPR